MKSEMMPSISDSNKTVDNGGRIVFFIRALFFESIMPEIGGKGDQAVDGYPCSEYFNKHFKITIEEYREKIHQIQLSCISKISNRIIYNRLDKDCTNPWHSPYQTIQKSALKELQQLRDDDIIIPLDDDDWLSPEIKFLNFDRDTLTMWNCFSMDVSNERLHYHVGNNPLPPELDDRHLSSARDLLSNCGAICASVIKRMIYYNKKKATEMLLRHVLPRIVIREHPYNKWGLHEKIYPDYLAVYVRHAGNITLFSQRGKFNPNNSDFFREQMEMYKNKNQYEFSLDSLPKEMEWSKEYFLQLKKLNEKL